MPPSSSSSHNSHDIEKDATAAPTQPHSLKAEAHRAQEHQNGGGESKGELQKLGLSAGKEDGAEGAVKRDLKQRHIAMIALGGTIGTGLFVGLGQSLSGAGPLSTLLGYSFMGLLVWSLMIALGEMAAALPVPGGFVHHSARFIEPAMGSAMAIGWVEAEREKENADANANANGSPDRAAY